MRIAFGLGDKHWTNHSPSELTARLQPEIEKFGKVLRWISRFEPLFVFVPIRTVLRWWGFSEDFRNHMIFPLVALFFGTGNQTPHVAAAVIARVFLDPDLRLFDYCPRRLLNSVPEMFAFPLLQDVFTTIAGTCDDAGVRGDARRGSVGAREGDIEKERKREGGTEGEYISIERESRREGEWREGKRGRCFAGKGLGCACHTEHGNDLRVD